MPLPARPTRLGTYDIIARIAGGGMATIYLGRSRSEDGFERLVAVKAMRHDLRHDERFIRMFLTEAKILSRLWHPHIAETYEFGTDDQQHFIAMELLVGRTLADVWDACKAQGVSMRTDHSAWIAARVAHALHYAHELTDETGAPLHLVHRDVNPGNVFLTFEGQVKLFDFGLAKASGDARKSSAGIVKGKLAYVSPEQVLDEPVIDRRSDIYTLATTLWEMTTMRRLFKREDDVRTVMAVRAGLVPDPRATVPDYPEALWLILRRALARDRDERYATAHDLAHDLDHFVDSVSASEEAAARTVPLLDALFPGEREKRAQWLRHANLPQPGQRVTLPPPAFSGASRSQSPEPLAGASRPSAAPTQSTLATRPSAPPPAPQVGSARAPGRPPPPQVVSSRSSAAPASPGGVARISVPPPLPAAARRTSAPAPKPNEGEDEGAARRRSVPPPPPPAGGRRE